MGLVQISVRCGILRESLCCKAYCGGVLDARYNGTIYSPGYPSPGYRQDVHCSWLIKVRTTVDYQRYPLALVFQCLPGMDLNF